MNKQEKDAVMNQNMKMTIILKVTVFMVFIMY